MPDSEYIFEVDVPPDVENFSNINTDTNPFEVSVKMKAAGNILSNLDARESLYSNAMTNDATLGICSEFIYDEGCKIEEAVIQFKIDDEMQSKQILKRLKILSSIHCFHCLFQC